MTSLPTPGSNEDLLARILSGELSLDDEAVQQAMRDDASFAAEVASLVEMSDELAALQGESDATASDFVDGEEPWQGADQAMAEIVQQEFARGPSRVRGRSPWRWPLVGLAAASITMAVWIGWGDELPMADPNRTLGPGALWPDGATDRDAFRKFGFGWGDLGLPPGASLELRIEVDGVAAVEPVVVTGQRRAAVPSTFDLGNVKAFRWQLRSDSGVRPSKTWQRNVTFH